jgi:NAD(P)-dependent dehydrogenase (short-subunit alcohol dehydrogenase family)
MRTFRDRVAVITGAASGIGRACALELARRGCDLALADVNDAGLAETAARVRDLGRRASVHHVDVADRARMAAFADEVVAEHGRVHIVINNAGVSVTAPLEHHSLDDFEWLVGINFWGVVYGCKFFLPHLRQVDEAAIVNISSMFGLIGLPTQSSYCATKFAVRGFSEAIDAELTDTAVRVLCVHPGGINTNIVKSARFADPSRPDAQRKIIRYFEKKTMPAEEAARQIVDAVAKGQRRLLITRETVITDVLKRLFPVIPAKLVRRLQDRVQST